MWGRFYTECLYLYFQIYSSILGSRKRKVTEGLNVEVVSVFVNMVKSRLLLEFNF